MSQAKVDEAIWFESVASAPAPFVPAYTPAPRRAGWLSRLLRSR
ncbi:hypothetical protein OJ997_00035 [Solirubrobacter phytolaccae]|uniref:Uncharacterized protein n=1 Tax=Solirubrobacter phytolaccae TaxID=1404360 RepID=A0A9X3N565_9ACTN|nr:hypothetical protein [Solirubrobacter phytolaccae]MDA0178665.1 hypothetical protein [Solirubrobacter phytolaccae]